MAVCSGQDLKFSRCLEAPVLSQQPVTNFGADTPEVKSTLIKCISETHMRHVEAQRASGQAGERVYAQVWNALPTECNRVIRDGWLTSTTVKPGRAGYKLPVLHNTLIFPWRPPAGGTPEQTAFLTSPSRSMIFSMHPDAQGMLELDELTTAERSVDTKDMIADVMGLAEQERLSVVVVAAVSSSAGLWKIVWGEVLPSDDGTGLLMFSSFEELHVADSDLGAQEADQDDERSFDAGQPPRPIITRRPASEN